MVEENGNGKQTTSVRKIIALGSNILTLTLMAILSIKKMEFVIPGQAWLLYIGAINTFYFGKDIMRGLPNRKKKVEDRNETKDIP